MGELVYDFKPTGKVEGLHHDCFNLKFLGAQTIQRASDIIWDAGAQSWGIWLAAPGATADSTFYEAPKPWLAGFSDYNEARDFEVMALNACRKLQIVPTSPEGDQVIRAIREGMAVG